MPHTLAPAEQLAHSTIRIEVEAADGSVGTGTGFFFQFAKVGETTVPAVVTNKHVVAGARKGRFYVTLAGPDGNPSYGTHEPVNFENFESFWIPHPDPDIDLCAMPVAPLLHAAEQASKRLFFIALDHAMLPSDSELSEMTMLEDVVMVGYPNGIWDQTNNMPILRRGVAATHPNLDWNGRPEFLIDAACFPGSSGSPVFLFNLGSYTTKSGGTMMGASRIKLLGILYAGPQHIATGEIRIVAIPTVDKPISMTSIPNNLGMIIKARKLMELDAIFLEHLLREGKA